MPAYYSMVSLSTNDRTIFGCIIYSGGKLSSSMHSYIPGYHRGVFLVHCTRCNYPGQILWLIETNIFHNLKSLSHLAKSSKYNLDYIVSNIKMPAILITITDTFAFYCNLSGCWKRFGETETASIVRTSTIGGLSGRYHTPDKGFWNWCSGRLCDWGSAERGTCPKINLRKHRIRVYCQCCSQVHPFDSKT